MSKLPDASVRFMTDEKACGLRSETVWANHLGGKRYKVRNIPMLVYGVSAEDIVLAVQRKGDYLPTFQRTIIKSGNRTVRVLLSQTVDEDKVGRELLDCLRQLGCGFEGFDKQFFAINVPPKLRLSRVIDELERAGVDWEVSDPPPVLD